MVGVRFLSLILVVVLHAVSQSAFAQDPVPYGPPISLEQAKRVMAAAEAEALANDWPVVIAIMDSGGRLVMLQRLENTQIGSIQVAQDKAYSAVAFRRSTKTYEDLLAQGGTHLRILNLSGANPLEGGLPILVNGQLVGGIGVSGVTSEQDGQIARAGLGALE